ncbi:hypothetical protein GJ744_005398 [Endocarpon pusillum]|uniref:DUF676 domain-containing protein n=1 Tax=Endocarpon pusillum TaxID=364733 RepID=A0A8H7DX60_9EURO|nr:hypothetical protein GJ744_005398 [Endocarpon pusillum]
MQPNNHADKSNSHLSQTRSDTSLQRTSLAESPSSHTERSTQTRRTSPAGTSRGQASQARPTESRETLSNSNHGPASGLTPRLQRKGLVECHTNPSQTSGLLQRECRTNLSQAGSESSSRRNSPAMSTYSDRARTAPATATEMETATGRRCLDPPQAGSATSRSAPSANPSRSNKEKVKVRKDTFTTLADCDNPVADVIFIHGLGGHPKWSWTGYRKLDPKQPLPEKEKVQTNCLGLRKREKIFWPEELLSADRKDIRILTYGYDSHVVKCIPRPVNKMGIADHGQSLLQDIVSHRRRFNIPRERPIIFVAHSFGGLVVIQALIRSWREDSEDDMKAVCKATYATIFFGTPHRGSDDAAWCQCYGCLASALMCDANTRNAEQMNSRFHGSKLPELTQEFRKVAAVNFIRIKSFSETQGKIGCACLNGLMVDRYSSLLNSADEDHEFINANHTYMNKFGKHEDKGYEQFLSALKHIIEIEIPNRRTKKGLSTHLQTQQQQQHQQVSVRM